MYAIHKEYHITPNMIYSMFTTWNMLTTWQQKSLLSLMLDDTNPFLTIIEPQSDKPQWHSPEGTLENDQDPWIELFCYLE